MKEGKPIRKYKLPAILILLFIVSILSYAAFYNELTVRTYTIPSETVHDTHVFAVISDLHCTYYGENQERLISAIAEHEPEAVFLTGDIADDVRPIDGCDVLMTQIAGLYPCYYVTGNHERWTASAENMKAVFSAYGAEVLDGKTAEITFSGDSFRIHGVDDPLFYSSRDAFCQAVIELTPAEDCFDILLSHRPEFTDLYAACTFDLVLSGHAHGGQIRFPLLLNGLYAPNQGWFPEYAGGRYTLAGSDHETELIVSRGLMTDDLPRIFNPPELVIINVVPE